MNVQDSITWEIMLDKFEPGHYAAAEAIKNICCAKSEHAVDHIAVTTWIKKLCSGCKNFVAQARLGRP